MTMRQSRSIPGLKAPGLQRYTLPILLLLLLASMVIGLGVGSVSLPPGEIGSILWHQLPFISEAGAYPKTHEVILLKVRLPRVLLSGIIGAALSLSGAVYQGVFRNPMADPYVIGVSSGAALGAVSAMWLSLRFSFLGLGAVPPMAFLGGLGTMLLVYRIASVNGRLPILPLLLTGIAVSSFLSALVSVVLFFSHDKLRGILFWLMGGVSHASWAYVKLVFPYVIIAAVLVLVFARDLNAMLLGEEPALHLGIPVEIRKLLFLTVSSLLAACAVAVSGMIGFVGLIVPHMVRILVGPDHRRLLPASALAGAAFLGLADTLARTLLAPVEIPVGVVTAFFGGPFFLVILRRRRRAFAEGE